MPLKAMLFTAVLLSTSAAHADNLHPPRYPAPQMPAWSPFTSVPWRPVLPHHKRHHPRRLHEAHRHHAHERAFVGQAVTLTTITTAAGFPITVALSAAERFTALIVAFANAGYHPRHIGCFAAHGHMRHSLHHSGQACDFDQRGWNRTAAFMYTAQAHALIVEAGLRDGCDFRHPRRDCGHVDTGKSAPLLTAHHMRRYFVRG